MIRTIFSAVVLGFATCGKLRLSTKASNNDANCASFNCYCADKGYWARNGPVSTPANSTSSSSQNVINNGDNTTIQNVTVTNSTAPVFSNLSGLNQTNYPPFSCNEAVSQCFNNYGNCKQLNDNSCGWDVYSTALVDCLNRNAACRRISIDDNIRCDFNKPLTLNSTSYPAVDASAACYDQDNIRCLLYSNHTCGWNDLGKIDRCLTDLNNPILTSQN